MPIYQYKCEACHSEVEVLQKVSDEPLRDCPECGEASLKKKVTAAAFRLKGGGWYETDFKKDNQRNLAVDKEPDAGGKDDKKDGKTDKKTSKTEKDSGKQADKPSPPKGKGDGGSSGGKASAA